VLCLNVSAGIGVIGMASPMLQEIFAGKLIGLPDVGFNQLDTSQKAAIAAIAAGFAGLLSLFNIGGRFFWASLSDLIGRKNTYYCFFLIGIALYALAPTFAAMGSKLLFVLAFGIILSMYGGGFATVPAYLADMFGTQFVGHPWPAADGVVDGRHHRPGRRQLHPRVPASGWRAARSALQHDDVHPLRHAGRGTDLQLYDQARRSEVEHELRGSREAAGRECEERLRDPAWLVRHRQGWFRRGGRIVLAVRRHSARLGRLEYAGKRGEDLLTEDLWPAGCEQSHPACLFF
jgi:hypothetical protein